jgi:hypothetical protein
MLFLPALALCVAVGIAIFFAFDPTKVSFFPPCMFHEMTGLDCPGCGAQRALHQLLHGNLLAALHLNAMFVVSLPLVAWFGPRFVLRTLKGQPVTLNSRWLWFYVAAWIAFGVLRNVPLPVFAWFAA